MKLTVLTGDIVGSTKLTEAVLDEAMAALAGAASFVSGWDERPALFGRRGGDGWQLALGAPHYGLRAALYLQANLRKLDKSLSTRIALASGAGDLPKDGDINSAHGAAFVASGRFLDSISRHIRMGHAENALFDAVTALADQIAQGWTQAQARSMAEILPPNAPNRAEIATRLGISRPAVNQALWSAGYPGLERAIAQWESLDWSAS